MNTPHDYDYDDNGDEFPVNHPDDGDPWLPNDLCFRLVQTQACVVRALRAENRWRDLQFLLDASADHADEIIQAQRDIEAEQAA